MVGEVSRRPYAATANIVGVIERARTRNLPDVINNEFLRIAGVPEVVFGRVTEAIFFLGLVDEGGEPTTELRAIAGASDAEYKAIVAGLIRTAYGEDFQKIDPSQDDQPTIIDAFRRYEPRSQTSRMVMLFLGLCREAGIPVKDAPRERKMQSTRSTKPRGGGRKRSSDVPATATIAAPGQAPAPPRSDLLFSVTEDDIAALGEEDFNAVWAALGKVARARSKSAASAADAAEEMEEEIDEDEEVSN